MDDTITRVHARTPKEWREWLRKNHRREDKVYLIRYKKLTKRQTFNNRESMDEAICFGWIDTTLNRIDDERYAVKYVKRNRNSRWSNATLSHAKRLIAAKKMTKAGLAAYRKGLKKPTIDHNLPRDPAVPADLKKALSKYKGAAKNFKAFAPSTRRYYLWFIMKAKRDDTRKRRIAEVARFARDNIRPGQN
ncbi:YdeI/OmpD-associated family protein [Candidatus Woesearchaeota archaeon]|nr:YdeI/OmpD-associated family protein [Candidatus Woesearchaeota archaeon]